MGRNKKKKEHIGNYLPISHISVTRYTYPAWEKCYGKGQEEEWVERTSPYCTGDFLDAVIPGLEDTIGKNYSAVKDLTIQTLDDAYFEWIKKNGIEDDPAARSRYRTSPEEAEVLFQQNNGFRDYHLCFLPLMLLLMNGMYGTTTEYTISADSCNKIAAVLEEIYGNGNVYVMSYLLKPETFYQETKRLHEFACAYFEEGIKIRYEAFRTQNNVDGINTLDLVLPIAIKGNRTKSTYTMEELNDLKPNDYPSFVCMEESEGADEVEEGFYFPEKMEEIKEVLAKTLNDNSILLSIASPSLISYYECEEYYEMVQEIMLNAGVKASNVIPFPLH